MASLHTFVVTSNTYLPGPVDPTVTIAGTVDGFPVSVSLWKSAYDQAYAAGIPQIELLVATAMYNAYVAAQPIVPQTPVSQVTGTFTYTI